MTGAGESKHRKLKLEQQLAQLNQEYDDLCRELDMTEKDAQAMMKRRIQLLHEYNDIRDVASLLLGNYASRIGASLKEVYAQFGVEEE
ncbi:hypothetical protein EC973_005861 [Apophysomyces ossiformis]|uniref:DNA repair protein SWI5 homolog n=1 Tax=Apophysomyces ossiformis TaxID=679940 RepID=A0A8H7BWW0_9FUNG|nr:hypothetical protein EC973_005861 [Apophysomyces ossiformis]